MLLFLLFIFIVKRLPDTKFMIENMRENIRAI